VESLGTAEKDISDLNDYENRVEDIILILK
jgi:hypothetical protein